MIWDRLLRALGRLADETGRTGDDALREWAALALLDAIDVGINWGGWMSTRRNEVFAAGLVWVHFRVLGHLVMDCAVELVGKLCCSRCAQGHDGQRARWRLVAGDLPDVQR